jgi:hypothetical protein
MRDKLRTAAEPNSTSDHACVAACRRRSPSALIFDELIAAQAL